MHRQLRQHWRLNETSEAHCDATCRIHGNQLDASLYRKVFVIPAWHGVLSVCAPECVCVCVSGFSHSEINHTGEETSSSSFTLHTAVSIAMTMQWKWKTINDSVHGFRKKTCRTTRKQLFYCKADWIIEIELGRTGMGLWFTVSQCF